LKTIHKIKISIIPSYSYLMFIRVEYIFEGSETFLTKTIKLL